MVRLVWLQNEKAMKLDIKENLIVWPGNTKIKPQGYMIPTDLKVRCVSGLF